MLHRPKAVAFDIIGTVFSLDVLGERLQALGLPPLAVEVVYALTLRDAFTLAVCNGFAPFKTILENSILETAAKHEITVTTAQKNQVLRAMTELRAFDDAAEAFEVLSRAGIRIFALSNGASASTAALLSKAGLASLVEKVLSVDDVKRSKPRPEVYLYAASTAGLGPEEMAMVACHPWDIHGAKSAGMMGGYVSRGLPFPDLYQAPDVTGDTLVAVARALAVG